MKKILVLFAFFYIVVSVQAQTAVCCQMPHGMAALALNERFVAAHEEPIALSYKAKGSWVNFKSADGKNVHGYLVSAYKPTSNWLLVCHEWWGLNGYIQQRSDELQKELGDVNVLAIDFYDGKVADKRDSAARYMSSATPTRINTICNAAIAYCGQTAKIATIGWCFGGSLSLLTAAAAGKQGVGCVTYYGLPDAKTFNFDNLNCDIDGFFAGQDDWVNDKLITGFNNMLVEHHKSMSYKTYPNAYHAFANPSNPKYDKEASADANALALIYLMSKFGLK